MKNMMKWFMAEEDGQGMVEYALILGLIALASVVIAGAIGGKLEEFYEFLHEHFPDAK